MRWLVGGLFIALACGDGGSSNPDGSVGPDGSVPPSDAPSNGKSPSIAGCDIFPADNDWNKDISGLPLHKDSANFISHMASGTALHPDWGDWTTQHYGIPYNTGTGAPSTKMTWTAKWGATESDVLPCSNPGDGQFCYPIPTSCLIEGGATAKTTADRHLLYIDTAGGAANCTLYETYNTQNWTGPDWKAANGAIWHLGSNALRPEGWTSADAAGLPILPGLVRAGEVKAGEIRHAIRFTMASTYNGYIHPATHAAGGTDANQPPMGLRVRLKSGYSVPASASAEAKVIITAMKKYGLLLADNGSDWYLTGDATDDWTSTIMDGVITAFNQIHGSDFEVVDTGATILQN